MEQAKCKWVRPLLKVVGTLSDRRSLMDWGLDMDPSSLLHDSEEADEQDMASLAWQLTCSLLGQGIVNNSMYSDAPPWCLAPLLSLVESDQQGALEMAGLLWEALVALEDRCIVGDAKASNLREEMMWPNLTWVRELLLALRSVQFKGVPKNTVYDPLKQFFTSWGSTKVIEDAINIEKGVGTLVRTGMHQVNELCSHMINSQLLPDNDRPCPEKVTDYSLLKDLAHVSKHLSMVQ